MTYDVSLRLAWEETGHSRPQSAQVRSVLSRRGRPAKEMEREEPLQAANALQKAQGQLAADPTLLGSSMPTQTSHQTGTPKAAASEAFQNSDLCIGEGHPA